MTSWLGKKCLPVISDVHGNIAGLRAVLAELEALDCSQPPLFLGDLFWTGDENRHPRQVLETVMELDAVAFVKGNTEDLLLSAGLPDWQPQNCNDSLEKTKMLAFRESLSKTEARFIETFVDKYEFRLSDMPVMAVHASSKSAHKGMNADLPRDDWIDRFGGQSTYLLSGHLHRNFMHTVDSMTHVCVGAVGRTKVESDTIADYALLSETACGGLSVFFQRVAFE